MSASANQGKLWAGRFQKAVDSRVNDFNSSIRFDARMFAEDMDGSIAHAAMLQSCGILTKEECENLVAALLELKQEMADGTVVPPEDAEDIHTFVEAILTERLGDTAKRLHTARSRNDQVALDLRLYLKRNVPKLMEALAELAETLCLRAEEHADTILPGYTHLQRAQPISFGHHLMAYAFMFLRDLGRIQDALARMDESPLGSGALAGTTYPIDRHQTAAALGFSAPSQNSLDAVSDRDFCLELLSAFSILMMHLSRFSEEIILWSSWEFRFIELDDAFATGSSIMPQKKNPDVAELVRGKSGRVYGDLMALLTAMKGLPLAYNKDMQEDKEAIFDALDTVNLCLSAFTPMIATMRVNKPAMEQACAKGFLNATDCADYLVSKGLPFRDAYKITGQLVSLCIAKNIELSALPLWEFKSHSPLFDEDVYAAIDMRACLDRRTSFGGPTKESVLRQIQSVREILKNYN
jgi:argininosuccinate lyase